MKNLRRSLFNTLMGTAIFSLSIANVSLAQDRGQAPAPDKPTLIGGFHTLVQIAIDYFNTDDGIDCNSLWATISYLNDRLKQNITPQERKDIEDTLKDLQQQARDNCPL